MYRLESVRKNLDYAYQSWRKMGKNIKDSRGDDKAVEYLGQQAGEILLKCRSCFDYAIKDILEIPPDKEVKNIYFPFSLNSLNNLKKNGLNDSDADYLSVIIGRADRGEMFDRLMTDYGIIFSINNMVNEEKHNKIHGVKSSINTTTVVEALGASLSIRGWQEYDKSKNCYHVIGESVDMVGSPGVSVKKVNDYVFDFNGAFIDSFILNAVRATEFLMRDIYSYLGEDSSSIDVNASVPFDASERAFQKVFPIFCFPIVIVLYFDKKGEVIFRYGETGGLVGAEDAGRVLQREQAEALSRIMYELAISYYVPIGKSMISNKIRKEWEKIVSYDPDVTRVFEFCPSKKPEISLVIDGVFLGDFSVDLFGIGMKFKNQGIPRSLGFEVSWIKVFYERLAQDITGRLEITSSGAGELPFFKVL